jgi:hypothetical protein
MPPLTWWKSRPFAPLFLHFLSQILLALPGFRSRCDAGSCGQLGRRCTLPGELGSHRHQWPVRRRPRRTSPPRGWRLLAQAHVRKHRRYRDTGSERDSNAEVIITVFQSCLSPPLSRNKCAPNMSTSRERHPVCLRHSSRILAVGCSPDAARRFVLPKSRCQRKGRAGMGRTFAERHWGILWGPQRSRTRKLEPG